MAGRLLVVWDFDWSLVNENSDTWVIKECDPSGQVMKLVRDECKQPGYSWTRAMDNACDSLHRLGKTSDDIAKALRAIPVLPGALAALRAAHEGGAELRILSDANTVYIETILAHLGIAQYFRPGAIVTNDGRYDGSGRLRVSPHQPVDAPHSCARCPANLCKGAILKRWLVESGARCAYVGDGRNDFCPATELQRGDFLLARMPPHDGLLSRCKQDPKAVAATVVEWSEAQDGKALHDGMVRFLQAASGKPPSRP
ncbi:hypothetical protein AB1Y20_003457 [Prymnesium parvum]|uniref:Uncharacterized protein n=1 Tax=Prymnesium parvum TaxID=97485 RepID=A0AB34JDG2_PRYPA